MIINLKSFYLFSKAFILLSTIVNPHIKKLKLSKIFFLTNRLIIEFNFWEFLFINKKKLKLEKMEYKQNKENLPKVWRFFHFSSSKKKPTTT